MWSSTVIVGFPLVPEGFIERGGGGGWYWDSPLEAVVEAGKH